MRQCCKLTFVLGLSMMVLLLLVSACQQAPAPGPTATKAPAAQATAKAPAAPAIPSAAPAATSAPTPAPTVDYPTRAVELVVPFGAGGAADVAARTIASIMEKDFGQSINIVNVTGAGGAVAYTQVKNAKPDGYKLLWTSAAMATLPAQGNIDFDYKAFDHVAMVATETVSFSVSATFQAKSMKDFLEEAKKRASTKQMAVGNSGVGSFTHLSAVAISDKAGVPFSHVAFGQGLAVTNLIGGHIDASVQHPAEILPALKGGSVRMLAVSSDKRVDAFRDVPTLKEQGIDLVLEQFRGVSVPKGTPRPIIDKLEAAFLKAAKSEKWAEQNSSSGSQVKLLTSAEYTKFVADQHVQIAELAKKVKESQEKK